jgi:DNA-binding transcriptional LysR family regulator
MKWRFAFCAALMLAACDRLPMDPDGTLDRIRSERHFRVGLIADGGKAVAPDRQRLFLARVARSAGALPLFREGASEPLLIDLEEGKLDLVIGPLSPESPWISRVALLPPVGETAAPQRLALTPIARNGENRWIMLLETEARALGDGKPK